MTSNHEPVIVEHTCKASVEEVWKAITEKDRMKDWYFDLKEFKAEVGFQFAFDVSHEGKIYAHRCEIKEVIPQRILVYSWRYEGEPGESLVQWQLIPEGLNTRLKLTHTGLDTFPNKPEYARSNFLAGWTDIIGRSLPEYLASHSL